MGVFSSEAKHTFFLDGEGLLKAEPVDSAVLKDEAFLYGAFGLGTFLRTPRSSSYWTLM
jgi:hypothetical protein